MGPYGTFLADLTIAPLHLANLAINAIKIVGVQSRNKCSLWNVERKEWAGLIFYQKLKN
jgi:hypothetical protein